ncbi:hypothetical protein J610_1843 [Acinetobacter sp. 723929]|nr:hypothetical protein J508_3753 [Acinetobacter sp. 1289694]EXB76202.1 hypothetical protein J551_2614 [Acinetobacter sp. 1475718]EXI16930.1 hypothetical protein J610_1843 [Acinetobacter sp. 723929]EYT45791.1 hypothetical protein J619_01774 [Acinetobacter sp. 478810]
MALPPSVHEFTLQFSQEDLVVLAAFTTAPPLINKLNVRITAFLYFFFILSSKLFHFF